MRKLTLTVKHVRLVKDRGAEAAREMALLWLVFSALDALFSGRLTPVYLTMNFCGCVVLWFFGIYLEITAKEIE
jgi:hypothetical protein